MEDPLDPKIALERYRNVIGYLQYENNTFWVRSGFMLVAHSALLGFLAKVLPEPTRNAPWMSIGVSVSIGMLGLALSFLWVRTIEGALWWIQRWQNILLELEPAAYGKIHVFRGVVDPGSDDRPHHSTRGTAKRVAILFRVTWISALLYTGYVALTKVMP